MDVRFGRFFALVGCVLLAGLAVEMRPAGFWPLALAAIPFVLLVVGIRDVLQTEHAVLRNYPVIGHIRWMVEMIRPEIRQYLLEDDDDATPFSRAQRSLVYRRAKGVSSEHPFGTLVDVYARDYEFIQHSTCPIDGPDPASFRITIGNEQCAQPYSASIFNISAMSFGSLSANAIRALNKGAAAGKFYHDTGEGSISAYHREFGGDIVWEIASGYFGCRDEHGRFDGAKFAAQAADPQVKMIEIKLSQGAKPGHGGILPGEKVTPEIARTRGVPEGVDCVSPARHSSFSTPLDMMAFVARLRELSGGKPVGFKLCVGLPWEFMGIVKAMLESGTVPDFVVVDGGEGGTGAAPVEFRRPCRHADARGAVVRPQHAGRRGAARPRQDRRRGAAGQRLRHRDGAGDRCRLGERGARLHVRAGVHPVGELQHQPLPDRRRDAGRLAPARPCRPRQGRARPPFPRPHRRGTRRHACRRGPVASRRTAAAPSRAPRRFDEHAAIRPDPSFPEGRRAARRLVHAAVFHRQLGARAGGELRTAGVRRFATAVAGHAKPRRSVTANARRGTPAACPVRASRYTAPMPDVSLSFGGETFRPMACGGLFWPARRALLVADLHFEKASWYGTRQQFLPPYDSADTLACLIDSIAASGATQVWCLGDSFHDAGGPDRLPDGPRAALRALTHGLDWVWITGNHDHEVARGLGGRVMAEANVGGIALRHEADPADPTPEISGHYHPKLRLRVRGRGIVRRCFAVTPSKIVLPAFGALTGGLDVGDPVLARALGGPLTALVPTAARLLRFPVAA